MEMRWAGYVTIMWEIRIACKVLVKKPEARDDYLRGLRIEGRVT
jgi:hypothetical protein